MYTFDYVHECVHVDVKSNVCFRSLIHLLCEDDETSSVPMVLCVSDVDLPNQVKMHSVLF